MTVSSSAVPPSGTAPPAPLPAGPAPAVVSALRAAGCVFAEDEAQLLTAAAKTPAELGAMVAQRASGLPLEHVVGWAEFCGLRISVGAGVFVPRFRSEFLAQQAAALGLPGAVVLDMCCGSGALGAAVAAVLGWVELHSADIDPGELVFAHRNVAAAGGHVHEGDLFAPLPAGLRGRVNILIANVPYVPTREVALLPAEARVHEPRVALDGGPDGLGVLRRVAAAAPRWLTPGGHLLSEATERQAPMVVQTFALAGLVPRVARSEERDATVVIGTQPPAG